MKRILSCLAALSLAVLLASCSSSSSSDNLRINLTDAPMMGMSTVNVTITMVRVHQSADIGPGEAGWRDIPVTAPMPIDLMSIRGGVLYELCGVNLAAGHYQQVRLVFRQNGDGSPPYHNSVMTMDGVVHPVEMPDEVKIVHGFTVAEGSVTDLTLDFRADQSMRQHGDGSYFMSPVITATSMMK